MIKRMFQYAILLICAGLSAQEDVEKRQTRVYADIVGDLFHLGHIEFFKQAKAFGDYLIIGVLSDEDVASYKRVPILTLEERVAMIQACKYVDEVIVAPPLRLTEEWIREHQIDFVVHGDDFNQEMLMDQYGASVKLGIFRSTKYTPGISTTNIIERVAKRAQPGAAPASLSRE